MKKDKKFGMNYVRLGGWINQYYLYVDLNVSEGYVADSLFYRRKIPVRFEEEMAKDGDQYRLIFCKVRNKYQKAFEEALAEIKNKMFLLGHNDYDEYCGRLMSGLSGGKKKDEKRSAV